MNHNHEGERCPLCETLGYQEGRLTVLRDQARQARRAYKHQKRSNKLLRQRATEGGPLEVVHEGRPRNDQGEDDEPGTR